MADPDWTQSQGSRVGERIASFDDIALIYLNFHPSKRCQFGEIPGFRVGSRFKGRRELCDAGVHAHLSNGIHGRMKEGAFSVVLCAVQWTGPDNSVTDGTYPFLAY